MTQWGCTHRLYLHCTTKGDASLKAVLQIGPISTRTVSIRHQSSRTFFYAYILPVHDLWTARFLRFSFVLTTKIIINFATFCYVVITLIARWRHRLPLKTTHAIGRLRTTKHNGRFYRFVNQISFHGSRRVIFTGCCSAGSFYAHCSVCL